MRILDSLSRILISQESRQKFLSQGQEPHGWPGLWAVLKGHFEGFTIYNPLGLAAATVFIFNLKNPWWHASIHHDRFFINAYAFILTHNLPPEGWRYIIETPRPAVVLLLLMLLGNWLLGFWGSTLSGGKGKRFLIFGGVFMLLYTAGFYGSIFYACHRVGRPVEGEFSIQAALMQVTGQFYFAKAYFYAIGAAALVALSSLIHGWIPIRLIGHSSKDDSKGAPGSPP
jgi:hypothetical protein